MSSPVNTMEEAPVLFWVGKMWGFPERKEGLAVAFRVHFVAIYRREK